MLLYKTVISSFVAAVLLVLSIAVASESPEPNETKTDVKSYSPGDVKDVNNFPVNGLPPLAYSSKKYTFHFELVSFFQAWNRCRAMGKRLASIENYQDHMAYREAVLAYSGPQYTFWIAATNIGARSNDQRKYYWITNDRPVGYLSGFENWFLGSTPTDANQCVATYLGSAVWLNGPCTTSISSYACEESQDV